MKKAILTAVAALLIFQIVNAGGPEAGRIEIGGSGLLHFQQNSSSFDLNPFAMFYIIDNFALGGSVNFWHYAQKNDVSDIKATDNTIGIGPRAAYYFGIGSDMAYPFVAATIDYSTSTSYIDGHKTGSTESLNVPLEGGCRFFLNKFVVSDIGLRAILDDNDNNGLPIEIFAGFSMFLR